MRHPVLLSRISRAVVSAVAAMAVGANVAVAQSEGRRSLDLTINDVGLSIGDSRAVTGVRINWRDTRLERVDGLNVTLWKPANTSHGDVRGIAIGLPFTGGESITGIAAGFGVQANRALGGISVSAIGTGAGSGMRGIHVAGIGLGTGGDLRGIGVGGIGAGAGGSIRGIAVGGIGAAAGGGVRGVVIGGIGAAAAEDLEGIAIGGIGVGAGGNIRGIVVGGIGAGGGGNVEGIAIGGVGIGAGAMIRGLAIGGLAVGAPTIRGIALAGVAVGGNDLQGIFLSPITIKVADDGIIRGLGVSVFNDGRKGTHQGLMIGLVNIADQLRGVQLGLVNIVRNNPTGRKVLPLLNWNFGTP